MFTKTLYQAVQKLAESTWSLSEADLERPWKWADYDEGVRFGFFRTYEELRTLAANSFRALSPAQAAMAQYHLAFRDLQAVLIGVSDEDATRKADEREWPINRIIPHVIEAERGFYAVIHYTIERSRSREERPLEMPDEEFNRFSKSDNFAQVAESGSLQAMLEYYEGWHQRVMETCTTITHEEIGLPSVFWESKPYPIEFRLHRFDAHLRQHTIHAEKVLVKLGLEPTEAKRLLRLIYAALAEVEGLALAGFVPQAELENLAAGFETRRQEMIRAL